MMARRWPAKIRARIQKKLWYLRLRSMEPAAGAATANYRQDMDTVATFLEDRCVIRRCH